MRFKNFLWEDVIATALGFNEPATGGKYSDKEKKRKSETIEKAIQLLSTKGDSDANDAKMADLEDKKEKWSNVDKETEKPDTVDTRIGGEEQPGEEPAAEEPAGAETKEEPDPDGKEAEKPENPFKKKKKK